MRGTERQPYIERKINLFQILITNWAKIVKCVIIQEILKTFLHEVKSLTGIKSCRYIKFSDFYTFPQHAWGWEGMKDYRTTSHFVIMIYVWWITMKRKLQSGAISSWEKICGIQWCLIEQYIYTHLHHIFINYLLYKKTAYISLSYCDLQGVLLHSPGCPFK